MMLLNFASSAFYEVVLLLFKKNRDLLIVLAYFSNDIAVFRTPDDVLLAYGDKIRLFNIFVTIFTIVV